MSGNDGNLAIFIFSQWSTPPAGVALAEQYWGTLSFLICFVNFPVNWLSLLLQLLCDQLLRILQTTMPFAVNWEAAEIRATSASH